MVKTLQHRFDMKMGCIPCENAWIRPKEGFLRSPLLAMPRPAVPNRLKLLGSTLFARGAIIATLLPSDRAPPSWRLLR